MDIFIRVFLFGFIQFLTIELKQFTYISLFLIFSMIRKDTILLMVDNLRDGSGQTLWINCPVDMCISMVYRKHLKLDF